MKYDNGTLQWEHGQRRTEYPGDWHIYLGPCPICGTPCFNYGGGWRCNDMDCYNSSSNLAPNLGKAPNWWGNGINVKKDGNAWIAYYTDSFINIQESDCAFGSSPGEAANNLLNPTKLNSEQGVQASVASKAE